MTNRKAPKSYRFRQVRIIRVCLGWQDLNLSRFRSPPLFTVFCAYSWKATAFLQIRTSSCKKLDGRNFSNLQIDIFCISGSQKAQIYCRISRFLAMWNQKIAFVGVAGSSPATLYLAHTLNIINHLPKNVKDYKRIFFSIIIVCFTKKSKL